jgi:transposase
MPDAAPPHGQPRPTVGQERLAKPVRDFAWKAQGRLCRRYRRLARAGKLPTVITAAIARELTGFIWAIARQAQSTTI